MPTLSNVERAQYALGFVKRELAFSGLENVYTSVKLSDGSSVQIDVMKELTRAIAIMQLYELEETTKTEKGC